MNIIYKFYFYLKDGSKVQTVDGISYRRPHCLVTDGREGDQHCQQTGQHENPAVDLYPVVESLQPAVHGKPGDGGSDDDGDQYEADEILCQQPGDAGHGGSQYLADADLAKPCLGHIGSEAEEAETGDKDGETGK